MREVAQLEIIHVSHSEQAKNSACSPGMSLLCSLQGHRLMQQYESSLYISHTAQPRNPSRRTRDSEVPPRTGSSGCPAETLRRLVGVKANIELSPFERFVFRNLKSCMVSSGRIAVLYFYDTHSPTHSSAPQRFSAQL